MKCLYCASAEYSVIYNGKIRSGSPGKYTDEIHEILKCDKCSLIRNKNFFDIDYNSGKYRLDYNDSNKIKDYINTHDAEQTPRIYNIGLEKFRNKTVLDYGCGGGSFLDAIKGVAKKTIGIEPNIEYNEHLKKSGHDIYLSVEDCKHFYDEVDVVISFGVIEHIEDPINYLQNIKALLKLGGELYLETDNINDVLFKFKMEEFPSFYYRTVHNWYFDSISLQNLCNKVGFKEVKPGFRHGYGLSNTLNWLNKRKPLGNDKISFINEQIDFQWKTLLEQNELAELLFFTLKK
jgi:2-polyprenyl-3-methyl-5-hydroxy-6-metoxy-1,4-benzoquinol methylase